MSSPEFAETHTETHHGMYTFAFSLYGVLFLLMSWRLPSTLTQVEQADDRKDPTKFLFKP